MNQVPASSAPPFLTAAIMAKNEERFLPRCLASLQGVVDEIVLVDTGSTDHTIEIAREYGAKVSHFDWCDDFSAARNETLRRASGQWVLIIDCDEYLDGPLAQPGALKKELEELAAHNALNWPLLFVKVPLIDRDAAETRSFGTHKQLRIFPRVPEIYYEMPIHNRLAIAPELKARITGVAYEMDPGRLWLVHRGYDPEVKRSQKKVERSFRILTKAIAERPDALNHFYLGREHYNLDQWVPAVLNLQIARDLLVKNNHPIEQHHLAGVYYYLVTSMHRAKMPLEDIQKELVAALERFPTNPDLWHEAGVIFLDHGETEGARNAFLQAERWLPLAEAQDTSFLVHNVWNLYYNLGQVYASLHAVEASRAYMLRAADTGMPDGELIRDLLEQRSVEGVVRGGVASIPDRVLHLQFMVGSILPQVDELVVYLNGFDAVPEFLQNDPRIRVVRSQDAAGDLRDTGKFWGAVATTGDWDYYFSLDDDILYPPNYVTRLVQKIEERGRGAVVGVHGSTLRTPMASYIRDRDVRHCLFGLEQDEAVDVLGTGTAAFHRHTFALSLADFPVHGMTDIWFSLAAKKQGLERIVIRRRESWMTVLEVEAGTLWEEAAKDDRVQTEVAAQLLSPISDVPHP
jgi:glycosyltransferase involved in cell wall biosynthesis